MSLWHDGAPVFVSELRPFHPLGFLPSPLLFALAIVTIALSGWRYVRNPTRARFVELTIVTAIGALGTSVQLLAFVYAAAAIPALRMRRPLVALFIASLLSAPWWLPAVECLRSEPQIAPAATYGLVRSRDAADHVPSKIVNLAPALPEQLGTGTVTPVDPLTVRVSTREWALLETPLATWPGWRVYANGNRLPPVIVHGRSIGTFVPPGISVIRFRYQPQTFDLGLRLAGAGIVLLAVVLALWNRMTIRLPWRALMIGAAVLYAAVLVTNRSGVAGGADSSGYLNQARLWRSGQLSLPVAAPELIPLGFAAGPRAGTMVPTYPPGLPLHMAILGDRGSSLLSPIAAVACLAMMLLIAQELGIERGHAYAATALLALSPVFVFQALQPMSDVVSTFWALTSMWCGMRGRDSMRFALAAGAAVGIGVLVRPTHLLLVPAVIALLGIRPRTIAAFVGGGAPFAALQLALASRWYGSPFASGYGSIGELVSTSYFAARFTHYGAWLSILFPFVFPLGLLAVARRWKLALWFVPPFVFYCFYGAYEAWWYTRFLLPAVPAVLLLAASIRLKPAAILTITLTAVLIQLATIQQFHILDTSANESVYERAAAIAERRVPENAIVLASQHSGSYLFYTGKTALRFDLIDKTPAQRPLFAVIGDYELPALRRRVPGSWIEVERAGNAALWRLQ